MQAGHVPLRHVKGGSKHASSPTSGPRGGINGGNGGEVERHTIKSERYPHRLNMYQHPPMDEITVEEFEEWAIDRLRLLADIEAAQARNKPFEEIKNLIGNTRARQYNLFLSSDAVLTAGEGSRPDLDRRRKNLVKLEAERRKDQYSHFVLRLAFCRSEELRQRFVRAETTLFKIRWEEDLADERKDFVNSLNFGWEVVSEEEKSKYASQLKTATRNVTEPEFRNPSFTFFKVDWTRVTDLVSQRKVFLKAGQAYVPQREEISLVLAEFSTRLMRGLELTAKALPRLDEDSRLLPVLEHLSTGFESGITSEYTFGGTDGQPGELVTAEMVPALVQQGSFPMCMKSLHNTLVSDKHLKHEGRQQFSLFLKGIGMSIEEALVFWRKSFKMITDDKFNKEYKYNIRHNYGLEGSRKNYAPKSCMQIITGPVPGPGQSHGCPFRHYSEANLTTALQSTYGFGSSDIKDIVKDVKSQHYHLACTRVFELTHAKINGKDKDGPTTAAAGVQKGDGLGNGESVDHPNRYFDRSRALHSATTTTEGTGTPLTSNNTADRKPNVASRTSAAAGPSGTKKENDAMDLDS